MSKTIRQFLLDPTWMPWWWTGPNRGRIVHALGVTLDAAIQWALMARNERFPSYCTDEALSWIGRDRVIRRGLAESSDSYRQRLLKWRKTWARAGSAQAILSQVQAYFSPDVPLVRYVRHSPALNIATWYTLAPDGTETRHVQSPSNWDWDSAATDHASPTPRDTRFWIIVYANPNAGMFALDQDSDAALLPGSSWDSEAQPQEGLDLAYFGTEWKTAGSWCAGLIVAYDSASFNPTGSGAGYPDGTWHLYANPLTSEPNRLTTARFYGYQRRPETMA